jgi:hypothetical protein
MNPQRHEPRVPTEARTSAGDLLRLKKIDSSRTDDESVLMHPPPPRALFQMQWRYCIVRAGGIPVGNRYPLAFQIIASGS